MVVMFQISFGMEFRDCQIMLCYLGRYKRTKSSNPWMYRSISTFGFEIWVTLSSLLLIQSSNLKLLFLILCSNLEWMYNKEVLYVNLVLFYCLWILLHNAGCSLWDDSFNLLLPFVCFVWPCPISALDIWNLLWNSSAINWAKSVYK